MNRIYFTAVPLESNFVLKAMPLNPVNFQLDTRLTECAFPIVPIMDATLQPGDTATVVVVRQQNISANKNMDILCRELESLGRSNWVLRDLTIPESQNKDLLLGLFAEMIGCMQDDTCYYACMTFGTKTYPVVLFSALSYADKICHNTQICGIYYQEIRRQQGKTRETHLYDVTALFTLNALVDMVAGMDCDAKDQMIRELLEL